MTDFWTTFAITILKGVLAGLHLDPSRLPTLEKVLVGIANDIYILYGLTPATPPIVQAATTVSAPQ